MTFVPKPDVCQPSGSAELAMLDVYMPMMKSAAIISAGRLGLFEALAKGPLSLPELAAKIQSSLQGTATLADFLVVIGYLEKQGECIANTASTQRWFTSEGQVDYTPGLLWTHEAWPMMGALADAVRSGTPEKTLWDAMVEKISGRISSNTFPSKRSINACSTWAARTACTRSGSASATRNSAR